MSDQVQSLNLKPIVPPDFSPPQLYLGEGFRIVILNSDLQDLDYKSVMESKHMLGDIFLGAWPDDVTSPEANLRHINEHYEDFLNRTGFTYSVLNPEGNECLGCIYIYPSLKCGFDIATYFWVHARLIGTPFEQNFENFLTQWLNSDWPFQNVGYPGRRHSWDYWKSLPDRAELYSWKAD